jgi:ribosomal protein L11 methyltransferase
MEDQGDIVCVDALDVSTNHAVAEEVVNATGIPFSVLTDSETKTVTLRLYPPTPDGVSEAARMLEDPPMEWRGLGVRFENVEIKTIQREDWTESWKKHFPVQHPAPGIAIKPSWLEYAPDEEEIVVELDPGMCFGTGRHPTTTFCIEALAETAGILDGRENAPKSSLEAGCGSGILSLVAWKLGFSPVAAFDKDQEAIDNARENLLRNGISTDDVQLETADSANFTASGRQYGVVAANMLSPGLVSGKNKLANAVARNGFLIIAGTTSKEYHAIEKLFLDLGFQTIRTKTEAEWTSGILEKI